MIQVQDLEIFCINLVEIAERYIYIYIYIHSPATLWGTHVQLHGNTNCYSANHNHTTQCISKTADLLGFSHTTRSKVYREWSEKAKISSERQLCGRKCLVDVRGQRRMDRLVRDDRKTTVTQITTRYNQDMQNTISEHTTRQTLKQMGYSSRRPHRVPILSAKNRKRWLQFTQTHQNCTIEDWKNVAWSDESGFLLQHSDVGSEFGVKNMKAWIILPCLNGSSWWWWWCNGVGDIFLARFGPLHTNWASFIHHSLPE